MAEAVVKSYKITREDQKFILNNQRVPGIQNIQTSYQLNNYPIKFLGMDKIDYAPRGFQMGKMGINALLISEDLFLPFTGDSGFHGRIVRNFTDNGTENNFSFNSGYLTNYRMSYGIGGIPKIDVDVDIVGNIGRLFVADLLNYNSVTAEASNFDLKVPGPGSITLNLDEFTTNRVVGYELSINVPRNPIFIAGKREPDRIDINYPIEINCNFNIELNDYVARTIRDFPTSPKVRNITLTINTYDTNSNIATFNFTNMILRNESYETNIDGNVTMNLSYQTFVVK